MADARGASEEAGRTFPGHVLAADAVPHNLDLIQGVLVGAGYAVTRADTALQVLEMADHHPFDAILLDLFFRDADAWEVCRKLKANLQTAPIPVLFTTAMYPESRDVLRILEVGGFDCITKPAPAAMLLMRVGVAVRTRHAEAEQRRLTRVQTEMVGALAAAQAQALESRKLAGLFTMARGLAHEINNPLAAALANAQFLQSGGGNASDNADALADTIGQLRRVASVVDRMRALGAEIEANRAIPIDDVVRATVEPARDALVPRLIHVEMKLDAHRAVRGAARLTPVVTELIANASRAVHAGGHIRIHTQVIAEEVMLEIADDGCGMDSAICERAFDPFFTSKKDWQSIGLGLSMCHTVVTGLGGAIELESAPGSGTKVRLRLPISAASAKEETTPKSEHGIDFSSIPRSW